MPETIKIKRLQWVEVTGLKEAEQAAYQTAFARGMQEIADR